MLSHLVLYLLLTPSQATAEPVPDKGKVYNIPYKLTETAHVLVRVKINGKGPFNYIIDTGSPFTFISKEVNKQLDLKPDKEGWAIAQRFEVEGGAANDQVKVRIETPFQLEGMNAMNFAGVHLHGIIGYDLLARYRLEFDFSGRQLKWTRLDFTPPPPLLLKIKDKGQASLSAMSGMLKLFSALVGKRPSPELVPAGFVGVELDEKDNTVMVAKVYLNSPADKAGLQSGDRIISVQKEPVKGMGDLLRPTAKLLPGETLEFTVRRGEQQMQISVTAGKGL
jgi:hypothetical protein